MKKKEWLYRELLFQLLENKETFFTQKALAEKTRTSLGNVNKSLSPLEGMNCIEKLPMGFRIIQPKKLLLYWASLRNLEKDITFKTRVEKPVEEIEKELPPALFTAYSGFKFRFRRIPADYSEVVVYGDWKQVAERFPKKKGKENLIVLKPDPHLEKFKQVPLGQLYTDLWNLDTWYAQDFLEALEKKIKWRPR
ncbi:MAG: hypothetical protein ISS93_02970 [Candidatus Aenigmarchaeota archaeon]|nr:hypothetical protein [Candidatus Aenigmarchaeota archaeon]